MEYRKLISFGKSSFVISLPKTWINHNKLKKGDLIYLDEDNANLIVHPNPNTDNYEEKEFRINIDGKDRRRIQREIIAAYVQNFKRIKLVGKEITNKASDIQMFIQNLIALEVIEHNSTEIVAKDFLNVNDISLEQIFRKMDNITRSMLTDCKDMFNNDLYSSINLRDNDVNKFRFLIYRIISYAMENPSIIYKKLGLKQKDLFHYWWLAFCIESVADNVKRIARSMSVIKLNDKDQVEFIKLLQKTEESYLQMMKAYYTNNVDGAHKILGDRIEILKRFDSFLTDNQCSKELGYLIYNAKSLLVTIHTIGRIVYQGIPG